MGLRCEINITKLWGLPGEDPLGEAIRFVMLVNSFTEAVLAMQRELCPVRTGFLQSSINADITFTVGGAEVIFEATAPYAQYVEYGTWKMKAQPFFFLPIQIYAPSLFSQCFVQIKNQSGEHAGDLDEWEDFPKHTMDWYENFVSKIKLEDFTFPSGAITDFFEDMGDD